MIHFRDLEANSCPLWRERCLPGGAEGQSCGRGEAGVRAATARLLCPGQGLVGTIPNWDALGAPGERGGSSRAEAASGRDRTRVCQGPDTGSLATAGRCCPCHWRGAAVGRVSSSRSRSVPEASKPAEQTARLGVAAPGAEGDVAAHWMPAASLRDVPGLRATLAVLPAPLSPAPRAPPVRPLSTRPLYHRSPPG